MSYTVKKLAAMSGVSVRTLHFYDEAGLLKPASRSETGYRFYEDAELLMLQQILFFRALGFKLKQIKRILSRPGFDRVAALESHRQVLLKNLSDTRKLIQTIDKTIEHLKGTRKMKGEEIFAGFSPEQQAQHEQALIERFGEKAGEAIAESKARVKHWTKADWGQSEKTFTAICQEVAELMEQPMREDSREVQSVIRRHYEWLKQFWTPTRESYAGYSKLIDDSDLGKAYEACHPQLPKFMAAAIRIFAETALA